MATINDVKQKMLDKMYEMDLTHMNLADAGQYVFILRSLNDIGADSPYQVLMDSCRMAMNNAHTEKPAEAFGLGYAMGGAE